jgi:hypothetical protein
VIAVLIGAFFYWRRARKVKITEIDTNELHAGEYQKPELPGEKARRYGLARPRYQYDASNELEGEGNEMRHELGER